MRRASLSHVYGVFARARHTDESCYIVSRVRAKPPPGALTPAFAPPPSLAARRRHKVRIALAR